MTDSHDILPASPGWGRALLAVLAVLVLVVGSSMTMAGGVWGAWDSANPLDPTYFGAGTADAPYCHRSNSFILRRPNC